MIIQNERVYLEASGLDTMIDIKEKEQRQI